MENPILTISVLPDICWCGCYHTIQYSIYNNFSVFCKTFNFETQNNLKKKINLFCQQWKKKFHQDY